MGPQGQVTSANSPNWAKVELVWDFMLVHFIYKFDENAIRNEMDIIWAQLFKTNDVVS